MYLFRHVFIKTVYSVSHMLNAQPLLKGETSYVDTNTNKMQFCLKLAL